MPCKLAVILLEIILPLIFKLPVNLKLPLLSELETNTVSIVSFILPDFLKNIRPSGTFIANIPTPSDVVVGIEPVVKLLKCIMFCGIIYKYCIVYELLLFYNIFF